MKNEIRTRWTGASEALPPEDKLVLMEAKYAFSKQLDYIVGSIDENGEIFCPFIGWYGSVEDIVRWVRIKDLAREEGV